MSSVDSSLSRKLPSDLWGEVAGFLNRQELRSLMSTGKSMCGLVATQMFRKMDRITDLLMQNSAPDEKKYLSKEYSFKLEGDFPGVYPFYHDINVWGCKTSYVLASLPITKMVMILRSVVMMSPVLKDSIRELGMYCLMREEPSRHVGLVACIVEQLSIFDLRGGDMDRGLAVMEIFLPESRARWEVCERIARLCYGMHTTERGIEFHRACKLIGAIKDRRVRDDALQKCVNSYLSRQWEPSWSFAKAIEAVEQFDAIAQVRSNAQATDRVVMITEIVKHFLRENGDVSIVLDEIEKIQNPDLRAIALYRFSQEGSPSKFWIMYAVAVCIATIAILISNRDHASN